MNYGFLTTETNSNALYIFHGFHHLISKAIFKEYPSSYGSSLVTVQIFVFSMQSVCSQYGVNTESVHSQSGVSQESVKSQSGVSQEV